MNKLGQVVMPAKNAQRKIPKKIEDGEIMKFPELYLFASYLKITAKMPFIIDIGCVNPKLASTLFADCAYLGIIDAKRLVSAQMAFPNGRFIVLEADQVIDLDSAVLSQAIVICAPAQARPKSESYDLFRRQARHFATTAPYALVAMSEAEAVSMDSKAFLAGLNAEDDCFSSVGLTRLTNDTSDKTALFALGGNHGAPKIRKPDKRVVALISCYNDEDFIIHTVEHLLKEGVYMYFIDNWSSDRTYSILQELRNVAPEQIVGLERFPKEGRDSLYNWEGILNRKDELSQHLPFDWFIHYDSDELRKSPWPNMTLAQAITVIDGLGYTAIDHTVVDFRYSSDGFAAHSQLSDYFTHFEFGSEAASFKQVKGWAKQTMSVNLHGDGGHRINFPTLNIFPLKFLLGHYSIRSKSHAYKKIFHDRLPRIQKEQREKGWHIQYARFKDFVDRQFVWDLDRLNVYDSYTFHATYLFELLTGIGLPVKDQL